ncbi:phosphatase PAP2 family protein [Rhizobium sp. C4]|uniref:phosphatase PAP2 family protein n=1 Tax=Rhizobium sp. C4 TaxID=1349800 RepID=UPI001E518D79|nr:phosphatase PAP2 family protein [Rhizobium sp. C4]MCD2174880.1 phosphatase PAP2 family protein [Rhizobium sp. C4]
MLEAGFFRAASTTGTRRSPARSTTDRSWLPLLIAINLYTLGAGVLDPNAYWHFVLATSSQTLVLSLAFIVLVLCVESLLKAPHRPLGEVRCKLRERGRFMAGGLMLFILGLSAYTTYKINIPDIVPFYADPYLAGIDRFFYGRNAWRAMHEMPLQAGLIVDFFYTRVWPAVLLFGVLVGLMFIEGARLQRYAWGLFFVYAVMGTLVATLFSSVGPIFYKEFYPGTEQFTHIKPAILSNPYISNITDYADYLLDAYRHKDYMFASGISAFPSVHVAVATLSAWFLTSFGRRCAVLGWTHALIIQYGAIYSGWHYAVDGDVSLVLVSAFWIASSRFYGLPLMPTSRPRNA